MLSISHSTLCECPIFWVVLVRVKISAGYFRCYIKVYFLFSFMKTSSLLTCSLHVILSIHLQKHIYFNSSLFICDEIGQRLMAYRWNFICLIHCIAHFGFLCRIFLSVIKHFQNNLIYCALNKCNKLMNSNRMGMIISGASIILHLIRLKKTDLSAY